MELTSEVSLILTLISLILACIYLIFLFATFSTKTTNQISVIKIIIVLPLIVVNIVRQDWLLTGIWVFNLILILITNPKLSDFVSALTDPYNSANIANATQKSRYSAPYDTVGTNCTACGAKNEYPVDGKAHYCTHCGTVLPQAY